MVVPAVIWGGIFGGVATATEVAGLAAVAALIVGVFVYREIPLRGLRPILVDAMMQTAMVMVIVAASAFLGWYLTNERIPQKVRPAHPIGPRLFESQQMAVEFDIAHGASPPDQMELEPSLHHPATH